MRRQEARVHGRGEAAAHDRLKRIQVTTDVARDQAMAGTGAILVVHLLASDFENGGIVGQILDVEIAAPGKCDSRRLQRQQEQQFYYEQPF